MIFVIGEALIDLIESRDKVGAFQAVVGGANANVALALARRGTPHQFLGRISKADRFGKIIREHLEKNGVQLKYTIAAPELTTLAVVSVDAHGSPSYSFYVNATADWLFSPAELPSVEMMMAAGGEGGETAPTCVQFGCLTMAMAPGNAVIEAWAQQLFQRDVLTISHDVNMRPALGQQREQERARVERLNTICHLIKASDEDVEWLYALPAGADLDRIVDSWVGGGPAGGKKGDEEQEEGSKGSGEGDGKHKGEQAARARVVIITRGSKGASLYRRGGGGGRSSAPASGGPGAAVDAPSSPLVRIDVPGRAVKVADTVGAGDTFCAHLLAQLSEAGALGARAFDRLTAVSDEGWREYVRVASVAASITCERAGCEPPTMDELKGVLAAAGAE